MPAAAARGGTVDLILSPEEIADELSGIRRHAERIDSGASDTSGLHLSEEEQLTKLFIVLRGHSGIDFSEYRRGTLLRRVRRRMVISHIASLGAYVSSLKSNGTEAAVLADDLLINVTSFFRQPATFQAVQTYILPLILNGRSADAALRIWVPGCSTGQEAYSLAICCAEAMGTTSATIPIQIFGTDLSERSIAVARAGMYSEGEMADVSPRLLERFFKRVDGGYQVLQPVRETCVFARHNVFADPPTRVSISSVAATC
jgi:two-component system, chemotaxis family, CheB/CheR fusion protein